VVFEEGEDGEDAGRGDVDGQLVLPDRESSPGQTMSCRAAGLTHCWMYFGMHDMRYCPYLCSPSALSLYLSAGFTMAALRGPAGSRGAYYLVN
jgi:hypothetical protein